MYMAAPERAPRVKPTPKNRCLEHPDAALIRRTTTECSVCHQEVAPERAVRVPAGTPPEETEHNAALAFDADDQNTPGVISESDPTSPAPSDPTVSLSHPRFFLESPAIADRRRARREL